MTQPSVLLYDAGMKATSILQRHIPHVSLAHYTLNGVRVHDVQVNGMPHTRPSEDENAVRETAASVAADFALGRLAGTSPRRVHFSEWDGDLGQFVREPHEWTPA